MGLYKISDLYQDYAERYFNGIDIKGRDVYTYDLQSSRESDKVGTVKNLLLDEQGYFRYFVVDTGFWVFGKTVLLPVGRARLGAERDRLYAINLTREEVEHLPTYDPDSVIDDPYEEQVSQVYSMASVEQSAAVETTSPVEMTGVEMTGAVGARTPSAQTAIAPTSVPVSRYNRTPELYSVPTEDTQLKLYEERLVAQKHREKVGEVTVRKRVETSMETIEVPVQKETITIEVTPVESSTQTLENRVE